MNQTVLHIPDRYLWIISLFHVVNFQFQWNILFLIICIGNKSLKEIETHTEHIWISLCFSPLSLSLSLSSTEELTFLRAWGRRYDILQNIDLNWTLCWICNDLNLIIRFLFLLEQEDVADVSLLVIYVYIPNTIVWPVRR